MILVFNTAIEDEDFYLHEDRCTIACEYFRGWFTIDFVSVMPFDILTRLFSDDDVADLALLRAVPRLQHEFAVMLLGAKARNDPRNESPNDHTGCILSHAARRHGASEWP